MNGHLAAVYGVTFRVCVYRVKSILWCDSLFHRLLFSPVSYAFSRLRCFASFSLYTSINLNGVPYLLLNDKCTRTCIQQKGSTYECVSGTRFYVHPQLVPAQYRHSVPRMYARTCTGCATTTSQTDRSSKDAFHYHCSRAHYAIASPYDQSGFSCQSRPISSNAFLLFPISLFYRLRLEMGTDGMFGNLQERSRAGRDIVCFENSNPMLYDQVLLLPSSFFYLRVQLRLKNG